MRFSHKKVDYIATELLLFCTVLLFMIRLQNTLCCLFQVRCPDVLYVAISIAVATITTRKRVVNMLLRFIHWIFRLDA